MPTDDTGGGGLPAELASFVGRRREMEELKGALETSRLVTVTGVGGVGKTRLALRAAAAARRAFDGVWLVDLTHLHDLNAAEEKAQDPEVLAYLVIEALGMHQGVGSPMRQLTKYLADRQALLVLDNCEHVLPACAVLVDAVLRACPRLRVLATSREPLTIGGETRYPVPPLRVPERGQQPNVAQFVRYDAVALFLERARQSVPDFALTDAGAVAVAELCRRLDGLPLAIELAAARVRTLEPQQILDRLDDRFTLLTHGSRDAPARQQALRTCVEWSFNLCGKPEQLLWARLSVFVGGFELEAVEGICADERLPVDDMVDILTGLIDKSIVDRADLRDHTDGQARYRMLSTLRDYGQEQLIVAGEHTALRRRHRDWYQQLAARAATEQIGLRQSYWITRFTREYPNVRTAVEFCLTEPDQAEAALHIVTDLPWLYWWTRGVCSEGLSWLERATRRTTTPTTLRVRALLLAGVLAAWTGEADLAAARLDEGEHLARNLHDPPGLALAASARGIAALVQAADPSVAMETTTRGIAILDALPEREQEQQLPLRLRLQIQLGRFAAFADQHDLAGRCFREVLEVGRARGAEVVQAWAMWGIGLVGWRQGHAETARHQLRECLRFIHRHGVPDLGLVGLCIEMLAWTDAEEQKHRSAATLLGAVDMVQINLGRTIVMEQAMLADHDACEEQSRAALGDAAFTEAFRRGRSLSLDNALAYALGEKDTTTSTPPNDRTTPLSRRERQVAELIAEGLTNKEIAARLVVSRRTAEGHVERILVKLGFTNRTQIAAWILEQPRQSTQD